jgi:hypothetical protein
MLRVSDEGTYGRPKRYKPQHVQTVSLDFLHSHFHFRDMLSHGNPDSGAPLVTAYQFTRPDGRKINYFQTIKDANKDPVNYPYPTLETWLIAYNDMILSGQVSPQDISIMPLVQVRKGREHFNTLCAYMDSSNRLRVLIIEPRSDNRMMINNYPVDDMIRTIRNTLQRLQPDVDVVIENPKIGVQPTLDDTTCGAHQINFVEVISQLSSEKLDDTQVVTRYLKSVNLGRREADNRIISYFNRKIQGAAEVIGQDALDKESQTQNEASEVNRAPVAKRSCAAIISIDDDFDRKQKVDDEDDLIMIAQPRIKSLSEVQSKADSDTNRESDVYSPITELIKSQKVNVRINARSGEEQRTKHDSAINNCVNTIGRYLQVKRNLFGLFATHTRHQTTNEIIDILNAINDENGISCIERNRKAAIFLYYCYVSIKADNSELRAYIQAALADLLDCKNELNSSLGHMRDQFSVVAHMSQIFRTRLDIESQLSSSNKDNYSPVYAMMREINNDDASIYAKFSATQRHALHARREDLFASVRETLQLSEVKHLKL